MAQEKKLKRDSDYSQSRREFQAIYATEFNPRFSKTTYTAKPQLSKRLGQSIWFSLVASMENGASSVDICWESVSL